MNPKPAKSFSWIRVLVATGIICAAAWAWSPTAIVCRKNPRRAEAINNLKNISTALFDFDTEYGCFPDASTAAAVKAATKSPLTFGDASSNQIFRQLLATGCAKQEKTFWVRSDLYKRPPDEVFGTDATALSAGECSFAYVAGQPMGGDGGRPVLVGPVLPGTKTFDAKAMDGMAIILRIDNSFTPARIGKYGQIMMGGMDIFDPRQSFWGGKVPDVKWPE